MGLAMVSIWGGHALAEKPVGPAPKIDDGTRRPIDGKAAEEERQAKPIREAQQARDRADLLRAAYEAANKPGPVPQEAQAGFDEMIEAYRQAIGRTASSPDVAKIVVYCHLRLAGAYQYAGQFPKAVETCKKAAEAFAGSPPEIDACFNLGLIYLQAMHQPREALPWFKRARELAGAFLQDADEKAKWLAATEETIGRCEREMK